MALYFLLDVSQVVWENILLFFAFIGELAVPHRHQWKRFYFGIKTEEPNSPIREWANEQTVLKR